MSGDGDFFLVACLCGIIITMQKKPTSAYVHIPFCTQICYYCDFSKVFIKNQPVDSYLEHLLEEFQSYDIQKLRTLYIGGGTPTALSASQLEVLLKGLTKKLGPVCFRRVDY